MAIKVNACRNTAGEVIKVNLKGFPCKFRGSLYFVTKVTKVTRHFTQIFLPSMIFKPRGN